MAQCVPGEIYRVNLNNSLFRMSDFPLLFHSADLMLCSSGALVYPKRRLLCVSDLHLGKARRAALTGGPMLPPFEVRETLHNLKAEIDRHAPETVVCLGDSFDDPQAADALDRAARDTLASLQAGRRWIWIEGNHDPGPIGIGGSHVAQFDLDGLTFRHIAEPAETGEISGHYHPKASVPTRGRTITRPCFLADQDRIILPAFGSYTGGLRSTSVELCTLMRPAAQAILTGKSAHAFPMPRSKT